MPNLSDLIKFVTLTATQTLTNKTLTAPTIDLANVTSAGDLAVADGGTGASDAAGARTNLGVAATSHTHTLSDITDSGTMASQNSTSVSITGGAISGITDLAVADGGTGSSTAAGARSNLGVAIGSNVQAYSSNLDGWSAIATASKQDASANLDGWSAIATSSKQDASANLTTYADKTPPSGTVVGTTDTQTLTNKTISGGAFSGDSNFDSATLFVDASTNRVGIGTSTPDQALDVEGATPSIRVHSTSDTITATFTASNAVYVGSTDALVFNSNSTEAARFDTSGRFLLGTFSSGASILRISGLPTSSTGLSSGDVWNDSGTLKIV